MNALPTNTETPDELDRLLADFFKAQLKRPWPGAPTPTATAKSAEPSELAAARAADVPRNHPTPARRDNTARARFTLAASVALMFGTCWYLSDGFQPGERPGQGTPVPAGPRLLPHGGASGTDHETLQKLQENKAKANDGNGGGDKIDMGKFE